MGTIIEQEQAASQGAQAAIPNKRPLAVTPMSVRGLIDYCGKIGLGRLVAGVAYLFTLSVFYVFGLFYCFGVEFFHIVEKSALMEHLWFYGSFYTVTAALISVIIYYALAAGRGILRLLGFNVEIGYGPILVIVVFSSVAVVVHDLFDLRIAIPILASLFTFWTTVRLIGGRQLSQGLTAALLPLLMMFFGLARGVHLTTEPATFAVNLKDPVAQRKGNVVLTSAKGVVFYDQAKKLAMFIPMENISTIEPTEARGREYEARRETVARLRTDFEVWLEWSGIYRLGTFFRSLL